MADSRAKYHAIPSSEDQAHHSEDETEEGGGNIIGSISKCISTEAQAGWTYFFLGCATLLPWNAMITATPFFLSRLVGSRELYQTFSSSMASIYTITILISQFYCTITSKQSSPSRRIFASIFGSIILIASLCFSTSVQGTPLGFFSFSLFCACLFGITTSYLCTASFAGAAVLGASSLQTVLAGQAAVGVAVSAVQLVSAVVSLWDSSSNSVPTTVTEGGDGRAEAMAARIFFGVSTVFLGLTQAAYALLARQPFYKSVTSVLEPHHQVASPEESTGLVANDTRPTGNNSGVFHVCKQNWMFMFSVMYVFMVTLAVYPAITVRVRSVDPSIHPLLFTSVHFLVFNVGDLIGRYSCSLPWLAVWSAKKILAMALLRTIFVPLLMLCNVEQTTAIPVSPIIGSDILFMIILLAMAFTNGYISTLAMLAVSSLEHNPRLQGNREDVDIAATLGGAFLNLGLALGSLSSFGLI